MLGRRESSLARRGTEAVTSRFDPWAELESMRTRMDDLFSKMFGYTPLNRLIGHPTMEPAVDICESADAVLLNVYVPGLSKDDVDLNVTSDAITISGQWKHPHIEGEGIVCHTVGLGEGKFQVSYELPSEIDPNKCKAVYKDGVLQVTLPKTEPAKHKTVKIKVEE